MDTIKPNNPIKFILITSILSGMVFGLLAGSLSGYYFYTQNKEILKPIANESNDKYTPLTTQESAVINAVKLSSPAVVSIIISKDVPVMEQYMYDPFGQFFGPGFGVPQYRQNGTKNQEVGGGSGFIVSSDGIILTNKHVVADKEADYTVFTNDGKKYPATVLDIDPVQDLAVIKIEPEKDKQFPIIKLGNSDSLELGQTVVAIGNALGEFKNTVSVGVISGLNRTITASDSNGASAEQLEGIIQTDAAINQGNSGGALINLNGEVVGINTATVLQAQSIGFSIPINKAKRDIDQIKSQGKIIYPFLGVRYTLVNEESKKELNLSVDYGAYITKGDNGERAVTKGSAAEKAGIKEGDVILEINGEKITIDNPLTTIIAKYNPGDKVKLKVLSDKKEKEVEVTLDERKD